MYGNLVQPTTTNHIWIQQLDLAWLFMAPCPVIHADITAGYRVSSFVNFSMAISYIRYLVWIERARALPVCVEFALSL
jgi:hypothetical protein